jgi:hypothetical protein
MKRKLEEDVVPDGKRLCIDVDLGILPEFWQELRPWLDFRTRARCRVLSRWHYEADKDFWYPRWMFEWREEHSKIPGFMMGWYELETERWFPDEPAFHYDRFPDRSCEFTVTWPLPDSYEIALIWGESSPLHVTPPIWWMRQFGEKPRRIVPLEAIRLLPDPYNAANVWIELND